MLFGLLDKKKIGKQNLPVGLIYFPPDLLLLCSLYSAARGISNYFVHLYSICFQREITILFSRNWRRETSVDGSVDGKALEMSYIHWAQWCNKDIQIADNYSIDEVALLGRRYIQSYP